MDLQTVLNLFSNIQSELPDMPSVMSYIPLQSLTESFTDLKSFTDSKSFTDLELLVMPTITKLLSNIKTISFTKTELSNVSIFLSVIGLLLINNVSSKNNIYTHTDTDTDTTQNIQTVHDLRLISSVNSIVSSGLKATEVGKTLVYNTKFDTKFDTNNTLEDFAIDLATNAGFEIGKTEGILRNNSYINYLNEEQLAVTYNHKLSDQEIYNVSIIYKKIQDAYDKAYNQAYSDFFLPM